MEFNLKGLSDYPAAIFPAELIAAYPEAAILLSTRDEESWHTSMMGTLVHAQQRRSADDPSLMVVMARKYHFHCWGDDFEKNGREAFRQHNELVRKLSQGRRFLEYQVKDGWGPLCQFLNTQVPQDNFPRQDDWLEYKKMVQADANKS